MPGQCICFVNFARLGDDNVVKSAEEEGPLRLVTCECLFCGKVLEICVVQKYLCLVGTALEVMAEMLESMNDSQKFFVVYFVVAFSWLEGLGVKSNWM